MPAAVTIESLKKLPVTHNKVKPPPIRPRTSQDSFDEVFKKQIEKFSMGPTSESSSDTPTVNVLRNVLKNHRKDDVIEGLALIYTWEEMLMSLSNFCVYKAMKLDNKSDSAELWRGRAHYFYDAIQFKEIPGCEDY